MEGEAHSLHVGLVKINLDKSMCPSIFIHYKKRIEFKCVIGSNRLGGMRVSAGR